MKAYLIGPDVFYPNAVDIGRRKKEICAEYGIEGLFPFDNEVDLSDPDASMKIYVNNCALMVQADIGIANLTPFRGPSADVGSVFELGYMTALNKAVFGYTNNSYCYFNRVTDIPGRWQSDPPFDEDGYSIEDFGNVDNLMIDAACGASCNLTGPNKIVHPVETLPDTNLRVFRQTVVSISVRYGLIRKS